MFHWHPAIKTLIGKNSLIAISFCLLSTSPVSAVSLFDRLVNYAQPMVNHLNIIKVQEDRFPLVEGWQSEINRLFFDKNGKLQWNKASIKTSSTPCLLIKKEYQRQTLLLNPRVDQVRCASIDGKTGDTGFLVGLDSAGKVIWQKELIFPSGEFKIKEYVNGTSPRGIVLDNLTVLSPLSGETLVPPKLKSEKQKPPIRPIPLHSMSGASAYIPERKGFISFTADVTLIKKTGGLYFIDESTGNKDHWFPVVTTHRAAWNVREMTAIPGGHYVLLAQQLGLRGSNRVSIAVFDLDARKIVYEDRFGDNECCDSPQVLAGENGNFGFAFIYRTAIESKRVVIHYRLPSK